MRFFEANECHLQSIKEIESECLDKKLFQDFKFLIGNPNYRVYVCVDRDVVTGYIALSISFEQADILQICVKKSYQRKGYASFLMMQTIKLLKDQGVNQLFLDVNENNFVAINLYKKFGFDILYKRANYYGTQTALIMQKNL